MDALPPGLLTDGESRGDAGNFIIVERLPTALVDIVARDDVTADYYYSYYCQLRVENEFCILYLLRTLATNACQTARVRWVVRELRVESGGGFCKQADMATILSRCHRSKI